MDTDPKAFIDDMHRPVCTSRELEVAFEYAGFWGATVAFYPGRNGGDSGRQDMENPNGYWLLQCHLEGVMDKVAKRTETLLNTLGLEPVEPVMVDTRFPTQKTMRSVTVTLPYYQIEHNMAESVVDKLIEGDDIDFELPKHKSEVRILPSDDPHVFDVTLLTGFDPVYIGSIGIKGKLWRPLRVSPGIGRQLRSKLHFVGCTKEEVALAMVEVMRPIWEPKIKHHLNAVAESTKAEDIEKEAAKAESPASKEQAEAGNYQKGHVNVQGLEIAIENAKGSTRSGTNAEGKKWSVTMPAHYGYIKGTQGKDKDHLDVYIGENPSGLMVFVVNQQKEDTKAFDEHKIMLGFESKDEALAAYDKAFSGDLGPKLRQSVVSTTMNGLKAWIDNGNTKKPFASVSESVVDSLLDESEKFHGFADLKAFIGDIRANPDKFDFSIGFAIRTSDQHVIESNAADRGLQIDWAAVNAAVGRIERNALKALDEAGIVCREEGHSSDGDLIGTAYVSSHTGGFEIVRNFVERDEPFSTGSGTISQIRPNLGVTLYEGVPPQTAELIGVDISFFDVDSAKMGLEEADENIDPKEFIADVEPIPTTWGQLKPGTWLTDGDGGGFLYITPPPKGADLVGHTHGPGRRIFYNQYSPVYAYGKYVQRLSALASEPLHDSHPTDELDGMSEDEVWALVSEIGNNNRRLSAEDFRRQFPGRPNPYER